MPSKPSSVDELEPLSQFLIDKIEKGENLNVDFKGTKIKDLSNNKDAQWDIAKHMMAMGNTEGGGILFFNIDNSGNPSGMSLDDLHYDTADLDNRFKQESSPSLKFDYKVYSWIPSPDCDPVPVGVLEIFEFEDLPYIVCKNRETSKRNRIYCSGEILIRKGASKTDRIERQEEARYLLEMALLKKSSRLMKPFFNQIELSLNRMERNLIKSQDKIKRPQSRTSGPKSEEDKTIEERRYMYRWASDKSKEEIKNRLIREKEIYMQELMKNSGRIGNRCFPDLEYLYDDVEKGEYSKGKLFISSYSKTKRDWRPLGNKIIEKLKKSEQRYLGKTFGCVDQRLSGSPQTSEASAGPCDCLYQKYIFLQNTGVYDRANVDYWAFFSTGFYFYEKLLYSATQYGMFISVSETVALWAASLLFFKKFYKELSEKQFYFETSFSPPKQKEIMLVEDNTGRGFETLGYKDGIKNYGLPYNVEIPIKISAQDLIDIAKELSIATFEVALTTEDVNRYLKVAGINLEERLAD